MSTGDGPWDEIPERAMPHAHVLERMRELRAKDADWRSGKTWCLVYSAGEAHSDFLKRAHNEFFSENGLNPVAFKSLKRMESDTVSAVGKLLNGSPDTVGAVTSGGTESILLAMSTYRERARRKRPWIRKPEVVLPVTAHPAFDKAAHYFDITLKKVPVDDDYRADVRAMKRKIGRNTIALVGSAPHYCQGVVDPIEEIAELARHKNLPLHVDGCVGGMMLPWVERLGRHVPTWDFRVPGVTSISVDLHKYGYAAKGASVIVYASMDYLRDQFYVMTDWPGGVYVSANIPGTRPGGPIAAAWAALMGIGQDGYLELTRQGLDVADRVVAGIELIDGLEVYGDPVGTLVSFGATEASRTAYGKEVGIFALADYLEERGWHFDRHQNPNCIHLTCGASNVNSVDEFLDDVRAGVQHVREHPNLEAEGSAAMYGMMAKVPVRGLVKYSVRRVMEAMYAPGAAEPDLERMSSEDPVLQKLDAYGQKALAVVDAVKRRLGG